MFKMSAEGILSHNFAIRKNTATVEFDSVKAQLKWETGAKKKSSVSVPVSDLLTSAASGTSWIVHYVAKSEKKWQTQTVTFSGEQDVCEQWALNVQEAITNTGTDRPKRLLVFINPDGGKKTGVKDYHKMAAPLFEKAGITTEVIVTDDGDHHQRVLSEYDISSIDGIVSVGGDGSFMRVAYSLVLRTMKDAGKDTDDKDVELIQPNLRVGILPAGTGQGMVRMFTGIESIDMATAALHIVLGERMKSNYLAVFNNNKLVYYCMMHACYGVFGDLMVASEEKRNLGRFRYVYAITKTILQKPRSFNVTVNYLPSQSENTGWEKISGTYSLLNVLLWSMPSGPNLVNKHFIQESGKLTTLDASAGRSGIFRIMKNMVTLNPLWSEQEGVTLREVAAVKYELPDLPEGSTAKQALNIDGDVFPVSDGEVFIKTFQKFLPVFGREPPETTE